jgi:hypothetical protein
MSTLRSHLVPRRWFLTLAVAWCGLATSIHPAFGWGRMGHRVAGRLAETRLSPAAHAAVRDLLEPGESLADASTWADDYRREFPKSGPWHYVNVPIDEPCYDDRYCPPEGCVVCKIKEFRQVLADRAAPREDRRKALLFLAHFVQDMHQPLHVGQRGDRGGNDLQLRFFNRGSNLHRIWDSELLEHAYGSEDVLFRHLEAATTPGLLELWSQGTVEEWASESLNEAWRAYRNPCTNVELQPGAKLGREYQEIHLPIARMRVHQAAVRLAAILNEVFKEGNLTP